MPKSSEEQAQARRDEIVNACAELYETMSFRDITLKEIGQRTSFTRTSIYNYFQTREEIFLALTQREYEAWTAELDALCAQSGALSAGEFAGALARTLERRTRMLKLMAMNLYDMEDNTRMENLVAFKKAYEAPGPGQLSQLYRLRAEPHLCGKGAGPLRRLTRPCLPRRCKKTKPAPHLSKARGRFVVSGGQGPGLSTSRRRREPLRERGARAGRPPGSR